MKLKLGETTNPTIVKMKERKSITFTNQSTREIRDTITINLIICRRNRS